MSSSSSLTPQFAHSQRSLLIMIPAKFGFLGEVMQLHQTLLEYLTTNSQTNEIILDFALTQELENGFPTRMERTIKAVETLSDTYRVNFQNADDSIRGFIDCMNFGRGGEEKDPPVHIKSDLLGPDALTSETRLEQDNVDDLLASLGM